jgi:ABC-type transport system involved in cytochrome c biogenesis permease subunit
MMPYDSILYLIANLILFALLLLYCAHLFRPDWVPTRFLLGTLLLFLICQGIAMLLSALRLELWAFAQFHLGAMFLIEAVVLVYLLLMRLSAEKGVGTFVFALAFVCHTCVILSMSLPVERTLLISPFVRSPWYLLRLFSALVAYGAYTCAAAGATAYLVAGLVARSRFAPRFPSRPSSQMFTRQALVLAFPWLSGSLLTGALWAQSAWGSYWSWRLEEVLLLVVWLILTMTLHARTMASWQGRPLALLSLLGFTVALLSLPLLGQGQSPAW